MLAVNGLINSLHAILQLTNLITSFGSMTAINLILNAKAVVCYTSQIIHIHNEKHTYK